ncbi:methyltransferase, FkbM family [alpha proteobacterium HIMB5]|nr:methyltransferase, FkbM family [alpha proteobacterium HIMB5]
MKHYDLVIIGAHFGIHLKDEIRQIIDKNILLVEPVPYNFEILKEEYSNYTNIEICTNAINNKNELRNFYFVKKDSIHKLGKHWASGIGSFNKQHILDHKNKRFKVTEDDIQTINIEFITFESLAEKYTISSIDKLQLDVEGAEYNILSDIDFKKLNINKVFFESKHFDGTFKEGEKLKEIETKLKSNGYKLTRLDDENILAEK